MENWETPFKDDLILRELMALERTIMSNQRTLLSFLRTSMYFLIAGLSIRSVLKIPYGFPLEAILYGFSIAIFFAGVIQYKKQQNTIAIFRKQIQKRA